MFNAEINKLVVEKTLVDLKIYYTRFQFEVLSGFITRRDYYETMKQS
jgi:hypothetical protein